MLGREEKTPNFFVILAFFSVCIDEEEPMAGLSEGPGTPRLIDERESMKELIVVLILLYLLFRLR